jgi:NADPH oxidase
VPNRLEAHEGDCIHFQWTGSDANPTGNAGNGRSMTDRVNIVELGSSATLGHNRPVKHGYRDVTNGLRRSTTYYSMFSDEATVLKLAYIGQDVTCVNGTCVPSLRCDDDSTNQNSINNCKELNGAPGYFDGGLVRMDRPGKFAYMSTRANSFSNRSQKAIIVIHPWKVALSIGGGAAGILLVAACVLLTRRHVERYPDKRIAKARVVQKALGCCGFFSQRLENSFLVRYPYTLALLGLCGMLYAVGFWMALGDADAAPTYGHAKAFGRMLDVLCNLIFLPVLRNLTSWLRTTPLGRVLPLDATLYFHKVIGMLIAIGTIGHIAMHYVRFNWHASSGSGETVVGQAIGRWTGISGHLIALCMLLMFLTAAERFRRRKWGKIGGHSIFVRVHKLWIPVLFLLWFHSRAFWHYSLFPTLLLILDKQIGRMRGKEPLTLVSATSPAKDVLHLSFKLASGRRFKFQAGQYLFLQCPAVSTTEWHPFTISSSPEERTFSVHIRCRPDMDWTFALRQLILPEVHERSMQKTPAIKQSSKQFAGEQLVASDSVPLADIEAPFKPKAPSTPPDLSQHELFMDGPYGTASEEVFHYQVMVLVAAGIGVTPFASILKTLAHQAKADKLETPLKKVAFYWVCRDEREFNSFKDIMVGIVEDKAISDIFELNTYLTGEINLKTISADEKYHQYAGRPNWNRIGKQLSDDYPGTDVGVFLCGPEAIANQLSAMCKKMNPTTERRVSRTSTVPEAASKGKQRRFVFHKENF